MRQPRDVWSQVLYGRLQRLQLLVVVNIDFIIRKDDEAVSPDIPMLAGSSSVPPHCFAAETKDDT